MNTSSGTPPEYGYNAQSGYRDDSDAGLVHIAARYYDAQVGLFTTRDTFLSENPYQYCEHDPINYNDPGGHFNQNMYKFGFDLMLIGFVVIFVGVRWPPSIPVTLPGGLIIAAAGAIICIVAVFAKP